MKRNLCSLLLLLVLPSISFASLVYNPTTGHWYERVDVETTWNTAKAAAEARGGYLAVITSSAENQRIVDNLGSAATLDHWLGGYNDQGIWKWVTGETWSYANWWPGESKGFLGTYFNLMTMREILPALGFGMTMIRIPLSLVISWNIARTLFPFPVQSGCWALG
jgi:hypothetical protein